VLLLAGVEQSLGIANSLASGIADPRNPRLVTHSIKDIPRARMFAIVCGYADADDLDRLRTDPGFKLACRRLPDSGADLCPQPTLSRWENATTLREVMRTTYTMIDIFCASYASPPRTVTLDVDDTVDVVHGHQQLALFNAHCDERCFLPIHVYDTATARPVAVLLRPGNTVLDRLVETGSRRCGGALRRTRGAGGATLRRDPLWRQMLDLRAARGRTHRGQQQWVGHPLRGDQPRIRQRRVAL
jgi:hypothetical protein